jgi:hypothetical protein
VSECRSVEHVECRTYSEYRVALVSAVLVSITSWFHASSCRRSCWAARPAVAQPPTLIMAAGSGPIRTSVRPSTLSTVFFITVFGLVPTVIGTTVTDTIVDSLPGVQSRHLHGVPALPQLSAPSPPQLAPLSRRALQTVPSSATDFYRQLHDKSVHSQLPQPHALSSHSSSSIRPRRRHFSQCHRSSLRIRRKHFKQCHRQPPTVN